jgi:hypothetical protein
MGIPQTTEYRFLLERDGFIQQDIIYTHGTMWTLYFNPEHNISVGYVFMYWYNILIVGIGTEDVHNRVLSYTYIYRPLFIANNPKIPISGTWMLNNSRADLGFGSHIYDGYLEINYDGTGYVVVEWVLNRSWYVVSYFEWETYNGYLFIDFLFEFGLAAPTYSITICDYEEIEILTLDFLEGFTEIWTRLG